MLLLWYLPWDQGCRSRWKEVNSTQIVHPDLIYPDNKLIILTFIQRKNYFLVGSGFVDCWIQFFREGRIRVNSTQIRNPAWDPHGLLKSFLT